MQNAAAHLDGHAVAVRPLELVESAIACLVLEAPQVTIREITTVVTIVVTTVVTTVFTVVTAAAVVTTAVAVVAAEKMCQVKNITVLVRSLCG